MSLCMQTPTLWLALAATAVDGDHFHAHLQAPAVPAAAVDWRASSGLATPPPLPAGKSASDSFAINAGLTGPWFEAATSGQGFLLDVVPSAQVLSFGWFTYGPAQPDGSAPPQRWLTGAGAYTGAIAQTTLFLSEGGAFQAGPVPGARAVGNLRFEFADCAHASVSYSVRRNALSGSGDPTTGDLVEGEIALTRVTADQYCDEVASGTAITDVTVLAMDGGPPRSGHSVVVRDGRIVQIAPSASLALGPAVARIDGGGRWLLPGLIDGHTHEQPGVDNWPNDVAGNLVMSLASGVTSLINMGDFTNALPPVRAAVRRGELAGPQLYLGRFARGPSDGGGAGYVVSGAQSAQSLVASAVEDGYDFIKSYDAIDAGTLDVLFASARERGLAVLGHGNNSVAIDDLVGRGLRMLVHANIYQRSAALGGLASTAEVPQRAAVLRQNGAAIGATLAVIDLIVGFGLDALAGRDPNLRVLQQPGIEYMDDRALVSWRSMMQFRSDIRAPVDRRASFAAMQQTVLAFHQAGVPIVAGSDSIGIPGVVPGFALHREIALLQQSGLSAEEAIASATRVPGEFIARYFPARDHVGVIAVGARADLLLVDGDPRADLARLMDPAGVMAAGRWYPRDWLRAQLTMLRDTR